jgi:hypothetical protein
VHPDRTVPEIVEEVPKRRTRILGERTEEPLQRAMRDASETGATGRFEGLAGGDVGEWGAEVWRGMLPWARAEERHYSWLESYMGWMKGREGRTQGHALLEEELASLRG